jgi:hypothetical protein
MLANRPLTGMRWQLHSRSLPRANSQAHRVNVCTKNQNRGQISRRGLGTGHAGRCSLWVSVDKKGRSSASGNCSTTSIRSSPPGERDRGEKRKVFSSVACGPNLNAANPLLTRTVRTQTPPVRGENVQDLNQGLFSRRENPNLVGPRQGSLLAKAAKVVMSFLLFYITFLHPRAVQHSRVYLLLTQSYREVN